MARPFITPIDLPYTAKLTVQWRVRHPSRKTTVEYATINARGAVVGFSRIRTLGDFGRFATMDEAQAALAQARLDLLVRRYTAFRCLAELVAAPYTPTLRGCDQLADAYDAAQAAAGTDKRACRR